MFTPQQITVSVDTYINNIVSVHLYIFTLRDTSFTGLLDDSVYSCKPPLTSELSSISVQLAELTTQNDLDFIYRYLLNSH